MLALGEKFWNFLENFTKGRKANSSSWPERVQVFHWLFSQAFPESSIKMQSRMVFFLSFLNTILVILSANSSNPYREKTYMPCSLVSLAFSPHLLKDFIRDEVNTIIQNTESNTVEIV